MSKCIEEHQRDLLAQTEHALNDSRRFRAANKDLLAQVQRMRSERRLKRK